MPDRPKRRKNNKNKRKNKNLHIDTNLNYNTTNNVSESYSTENINEREGKSDIHLNEEKYDMENNILQKTSNDFDKDSSNKENKIIISSEIETVKGREFFEIFKTPLDIPIEEKHDGYVVEAPDKSNKEKSKLSSRRKSKSVDDDESPKIIEITEENSVLPDHDNINTTENTEVLISEIDSDIKWEQTMDINVQSLLTIEEPITGTLSEETITLTKANCEQAKLLSPEEELSLRHYLQTLNLTTNSSTSLEIKAEIEQIINSEIKHRLRKKELTDDVFCQRLCAPRILDVIDEEVSGESSTQSRRHSYLSDKSNNDDLEDDVFGQSQSQTTAKKNEGIKEVKILRKKSSRQQMPQKCVLVGAKLKEPEISEARGDWTIQTVEKMTGVEVVYLTDSSSSTSSLYDVGEDTGNDHDSDATIRMITPTIEVTDTENLLKKTFVPDNDGIRNTSIDKCDTVNFTSEKSDRPPLDTEGNNKFNEIEQKLHEVVVLTTDNIKTNLTVKDIDGSKKVLNEISNETVPHRYDRLESENKSISSKYANDYDLEMKVLKCELNDAINNLIKEVSDSESVNEDLKETFKRRDSASSISSSQCTAIYNPNSSLIDIYNNDDLSQLGTNSIAASHVNDVIETITKNSFINESTLKYETKQPQKLRDMCVERILSFPYGLKILEELANVSLRLQNINNLEYDAIEESKYCKLKNEDVTQKTNDQFKTQFYQKTKSEEISQDQKNMEELYSLTPPPIPPPPLIPRNSSLKKSKDNSNFDTSTTEKQYVCLSPSQKMLMEKTNTIFTKENFSDKDGSEKNNNLTYYSNSKQTDKTSLKSQTGSRLMALICDPSITSNINFSVNKFCDMHSNNKTKIKLFNYPERYNEPTLKLTPNYKPTPPPRPKKVLPSYCENDKNFDCQDNSFKSLKKEKKNFHFSTGNLNKEIEDDITNIQNMHRNYLNVRNHTADLTRPRRPSLPKDLCDQQMEYIMRKEKEVEAEIRRLEGEKLKEPLKKGPRAPMITEKAALNESVHIPNQKSTKEILWNTCKTDKKRRDQNTSFFSSSQEELLREKMYSEYLNEIAEREQRKHHKVIKITNIPLPSNSKFISKSMSALDILESRVNNRIEEEFICKARERWNNLGIKDPESEDETHNNMYIYREPKVKDHKIKVIEAGKEKDVLRLPIHLQEFVTFTVKDKKQESGCTGESEEKSTHVVILCAVILLVLAIGRHILRFLRNIY